MSDTQKNIIIFGTIIVLFIWAGAMLYWLGFAKALFDFFFMVADWIARPPQ